MDPAQAKNPSFHMDQVRRDLGVGVTELRERLPWLGGDLQTVAHRITFRKKPIPGDQRAMEFPLNDDTGDVMTGTLHDPGQSRPLVVLLHGVAGNEDSVYLWDTARHLTANGWPVLRLNHRGAGSSLTRCVSTYHCGGAEDIAAVLNQLPDNLTRHGVFLAGFSMGGTILLNMLATQICEPEILGGMTISAPLDLIASAERLHRARNVIYQRSLLSELMKMEVTLRQNGRLAPQTPLPRPTSLRAYDDLVTAKRHGFADGMDYYRQCSPTQRLSNITKPVVMLHAMDDPWIPAEAYRDVKHSNAENFHVVLTPRGGHVGFHFRGQERPLFATMLNQTLNRLWG